MVDLALVALVAAVLVAHFWHERRTARDHAKERARPMPSRSFTLAVR